jgi:hypothetical protein
MDLRLATLKAVSFYLLQSVSTLNINAESYPVAQLCVNILLDTKVTLITDGMDKTIKEHKYGRHS